MFFHLSKSSGLTRFSSLLCCNFLWSIINNGRALSWQRRVTHFQIYFHIYKTDRTCLCTLQSPSNPVGYIKHWKEATIMIILPITLRFRLDRKLLYFELHDSFFPFISNTRRYLKLVPGLLGSASSLFLKLF